jgi:DNA-directed RNA polymerase subunit RPC12/RpoP
MSAEKNNVEKINRISGPSPEKKPVARAAGVQCLRCRSELKTYRFTKLSFAPYGAAGNVVLECPNCGHIELMSENSPLLRRLNAKPVAVGDGD